MKDHHTIIKAAGGILWRKQGDHKEIALIHRPKHDDWSLPKGKLAQQEGWVEAALREVLEETGYRCDLGTFAGSISYLIKDRPKVVLFWNMTIRQHDPDSMNGEVDQVVWLREREALNLLDYPDERELLRSDLEIREKGT